MKLGNESIAGYMEVLGKFKELLMPPVSIMTGDVFVTLGTLHWLVMCMS